MNTNTKLTIALLGVAGIGLAIAGTSFAKDYKSGGRGGHGAGGAMMMFENFDTDGDGSVTREEAQGYINSQLSDNDVDSDGALTLDEFEGVWIAQMRTPMVRAFQRLDSDGDGIITDAEIDQPLDRMFARADRNDDGMIERSELRRGGRHHNRDRDGDADN